MLRTKIVNKLSLNASTRNELRRGLFGNKQSSAFAAGPSFDPHQSLNADSHQPDQRGTVSGPWSPLGKPYSPGVKVT